MIKLWRESWAIAERILIELWRRRRSLIFWALFPVIVLVLNGLILAERAKLSSADAFAQAAPATLVGAALFFSCVGGSVATVVGEREHQTLKRLFLTPLSGLSYFLGIFLAHCVIGLGQTLLVLIVTLGLGAEFIGSLWIGAIIILSQYFRLCGGGIYPGHSVGTTYRRCECLGGNVRRAFAHFGWGLSAGTHLSAKPA
jgi:ABC-2 type transport system permease protein